jgi:DNA-directed RNA polymerase subunit alpha
MTDNATMVSLDELMARDNWTVADHDELLTVLFETHDPTDKLAAQLGACMQADPEPRGAAALKVGILLFTLTRFDEALEMLAQATDNRDRNWFQAMALTHLKRYADAADAFDRARDKGCDASLVNLKLAELTALSGQVDDAAKMLKKLEKSMSEDAGYQCVLGLVAQLEGFSDAAFDAFEKAIELDADCAEAMFRLAYFCDLHGDEDRALELYEACTSRPPVHANALLNMAILHEDAGRYAKAVAALDRVLASNPNHPRAKLILKDCESSMDMFYDEDQVRRQAFTSAVLDTPVTDFELSVRARNCLKKMNIRTLGDLVRTSETTLMSYKNFGETSLKEIKEMLSAKGLSLGQAIEDSMEPNIMSLISSAPADRPDIEGASDELIDMPILQVEFSIRVQRAMDTLKIRTLGELVSKTEADLMTCSNFGQTSLNEVHAKLTEYGLKLNEIG